MHQMKQVSSLVSGQTKSCCQLAARGAISPAWREENYASLSDRRGSRATALAKPVTCQDLGQRPQQSGTIVFPYLKSLARADGGGVDKSKALSPRSSAKDRDSSAIITHCELLFAGAKSTQSNSRFHGGIISDVVLIPIDGADKLPVRGVEQKTPPMRRRFPYQQPLAVGRPTNSLCIDSVGIP